MGLMLPDCKSAQLKNPVALEPIRRYGLENVFYFENNVKIAAALSCEVAEFDCTTTAGHCSENLPRIQSAYQNTISAT